MPHYDRYYPDYLRKYPGIERWPEVLQELRRSDRKMKYIEADLKGEIFIEDQQNEIAAFIPSREDSYERQLEEKKRRFEVCTESPEEYLIRKEILVSLRSCLAKLTAEEFYLIIRRYWDGATQAEVTQELQKSQQAISYQESKI